MTKKSSFDSSFSKVLFAHLLPFQAYLSLGKQRKERVDLSVFVIYSILAEMFKSRFSPYVQRALIERSTAADPCLIFVKDLWVCEKDAAQSEEKPTPQEGVKLNFVCLILSHLMFIVSETEAKRKVGGISIRL